METLVQEIINSIYFPVIHNCSNFREKLTMGCPIQTGASKAQYIHLFFRECSGKI